MNAADVDQKISNFFGRKQAEYPDLITAGRHGSRTVKYALNMRTTAKQY